VIRHAKRWGKVLAQLGELRYGFTSRGRTKIESKEELRWRRIPSPDWADAVALAFGEPPRVPPIPPFP
jgi:phage terminase large subunit